MSVAKDFCVISARMYCEGKTHNEWIFTVLFSPNVYSRKLIKSGNTFFSPNERGSEWKTTKSANALKTSLHSRSRPRFTFSRTDLFLLQAREGERRISFLGSTCICLLCPDPANPSALVGVPLVLTQTPTVRKHVGMKRSRLQDWLLRLFLCILVLHCMHCNKSH